VKIIHMLDSVVDCYVKVCAILPTVFLFAIGSDLVIYPRKIYFFETM
jgi:hypothetical protein